MNKPTRKPPRRPASTVSPARFEAFTILMQIERDREAYADDLLRAGRVSALSSQDRNLCTALVMGVLRWQIMLDAQIRRYLSKPNAKLDPAVRIALRLGAFQLFYLDRIPAHAAIGESVSLAKLAGHTFAARMVNAVLRMIAQQPKAKSPAENATVAEFAEATSHPLWMVERWAGFYGPVAARALCEHGQRQPELAIRCDSAELEAALAGQGIELASGSLLTAARRVLAGDITTTAAFREGHIRIQDEGSQLIAELASAANPTATRILDACAAPGGKTLILAERSPDAQIVAFDLSATRLAAMRERFAATPAAAKIEPRQADAARLSENFVPGDGYDLILADVPCSGTGTLARNPEIRHRLQLADLARHHQAQCAILQGVLGAAGENARVLYSTCSLEPEENASVVAEVLVASTGWRQLSLQDTLQSLAQQSRLTTSAANSLASALAPDGSLTLLPGSLGPDAQTDGFFAALLERT